MNLATIEIDEAEATRALAEYEKMLASERTVEDDAIAAGYRAAKRGLPVIELSKAIAAGGFFDNGLPKLAVVRADATQCFVHSTSTWSHTGEALVFADSRNADSRGALVGTHTVLVHVDNLPTRSRPWSRASTIVPTIPPRFRPRRNRLARRHILWEVEAWEPIPPKDPALLHHIRGDLWAVEAVWDLTPLERAVLSQRAHT